MSKTLTITLSDDLEQALAQVITQTQQSPEELILDLLSERLKTPSVSSQSDLDDPLLELVGSITTDFTDVGENHDFYLGQGQYSRGPHQRSPF